MRFVKELLSQLNSDFKSMYKKYFGGTVYVIVSLAIMLASLALVLGMPEGTPTERLIQGLVGFAVLIIEVVGTIWIWDAAKKARYKIAVENNQLLDSIQTPEKNQ